MTVPETTFCAIEMACPGSLSTLDTFRIVVRVKLPQHPDPRRDLRIAATAGGANGEPGWGSFSLAGSRRVTHTWPGWAMTPRPSPSGGSLCALPSVRSGPLPVSSHAEAPNELPADRGCRHWWWAGGASNELLLDRAGLPAHRARAGMHRRELAQQAMGLAAPGRSEPDP